MSSIPQEPDATPESLEPSTAAAQEAWEKRLSSRSDQLTTGRQGAELQQVMDDLRGGTQ